MYKWMDANEIGFKYSLAKNLSILFEVHLFF